MWKIFHRLSEILIISGLHNWSARSRNSVRSKLDQSIVECIHSGLIFRQSYQRISCVPCPCTYTKNIISGLSFFSILNKAMLRNWRFFVSQSGFKLGQPKTNVFKFLSIDFDGDRLVWLLWKCLNDVHCLQLVLPHITSISLWYKTKMYYRFKFIFSVSDSVSCYRPPMNLRQGKAFSHVCQSLCSNVLNLVYLWTPPDPSPVRTPFSPGYPPIGVFNLVQLDLTVQAFPLDWLKSGRLVFNWKAFFVW